MKFHAKLFLFLFAFAFSGAMAQGFEGFPVSEKSNVDPNEELSEIDANTMFDRYLVENFAPDQYSLPGKAIVLLIPKTGCHFCINETIEFYQKHHAKYPKLLIAYAGSPEGIDNADFVVEQLCVDKGNASKKYGFGEVFPSIAFLENRKTIAVVQVDAKSAEAQLAKVLVFLEE